MKILLLIMVSLTSLLAQSQSNGWEITLNNRIFLEIPAEIEKAPVRRISKSEWIKKGSLEIKYYNTEKNSWKRSFSLTDQLENEMLVAENTSYVKISLMKLRRLFKGKKEIRIYTTISPPNPLMGAPSRRIHLCTLRLP